MGRAATAYAVVREWLWLLLGPTLYPLLRPGARAARRLKRGLRRLSPPNGQPYELFNAAVFVLALVVINYVAEDPTVNQQAALGFMESVVSLQLWGVLLAACATGAAAASYVPAWVDAGYGLLFMGCVLWATAFVFGIAFFDGEVRSMGSALIYAFVARQLIHEGRRIA